MATETQFHLTEKGRDCYLDLVKVFPLVSIKTEKHFKQARCVIDDLCARGKLDSGTEAYVDALTDLMATFEDRHHAIEPATDSEMLRHFMDAKGVTQTQLSQQTGISKSIISEVLSGRRLFSRQMIRSLSKYFDVDTSVLASNF